MAAYRGWKKVNGVEDKSLTAGEADALDEFLDQRPPWER